MPYGVKRGLKTPGEFAMGDIMGLALSGAAGIVAALITDYQQQAEASALYTLNHWSVSLGSLIGYTEIPLWWVIAGLVSVGAGSIFYFQPITRQGAFAQGFGLLAVIMTAIPADLASGIEDIANDSNLPGLGAPLSTDPVPADADPANPVPTNPVPSDSVPTDPRPEGEDIPVIDARFAPGNAAKVARTLHMSAPVPAIDTRTIERERGHDAGVIKAAVTTVALERDPDGPASYTVRLYIKFEDGWPGDVNTLIRRGLLRGRLHNRSTGETFNLFRTAGGKLRKRGGDTLIIDAGVPARSAEAELWVRIECSGHKIEEQSAKARLGRPLEWRINVKKSSTPLFIQRLGRVYRY
ncbi:MAG: hypothetical protein AAFO78_02130 [Pseudomonadota bacterium]